MYYVISCQIQDKIIAPGITIRSHFGSSHFGSSILDLARLTLPMLPGYTVRLRSRSQIRSRKRSGLSDVRRRSKSPRPLSVSSRSTSRERSVEFVPKPEEHKDTVRLPKQLRGSIGLALDTGAGTSASISAASSGAAPNPAGSFKCEIKVGVQAITPGMDFFYWSEKANVWIASTCERVEDRGPIRWIKGDNCYQPVCRIRLLSHLLEGYSKPPLCLAYCAS